MTTGNGGFAVGSSRGLSHGAQHLCLLTFVSFDRLRSCFVRTAAFAVGVCDVGSRPCCHTVVGLYCQDAFGTAWCMPLPTLRPRCLCLTPVCTAACGLLSACWLAAFLVLCACPEPPPRCQFWQKEEASIAVTEPGLAGQHRIRRHLACRCASQQRCFTSHSRDPSSPAFGPPASTS